MALGDVFEMPPQDQVAAIQFSAGANMGVALDVPLTNKTRFRRFWKISLRRVIIPCCVYIPLVYFFPLISLVYLICGAYDVSRNTGLNLSTIRRYFFGNGVLLWILSPINVLLDILSLPYINKGVYRLEDLPPGHQEEINRLIKGATDADLVRQVEERSKEHKRALILWRYYGVPTETIVDVPAFNGPWKYVQTIGLSVFNTKISTSLHFGWMRASLRVLYNINDIEEPSAYIVVGDTTHRWCDGKLFIFDDTLQHLSANETDRPRYCMYVDILRPTPFPRVMAAVCAAESYIARKIKLVSLSKWTLVEQRR
jgi:Aspartyl/Asparaginyl beta-hydroxylase